MRIRKNIAVSEEGFLFNPATGDSFSTNGIGSEIIRMLKQDKSTHEITDEICRGYDVDRLLFERDLDEFTALLKDYSILE
ncbi:MAG: PqqD family protein [Paludibacter sp.]|nr:PqqD family protein [Paludibacter sp.]MDD4428192.1 PqqD family protein [Paludibacter sp.]